MEAHPRGQPTDRAFAARLKESVAAVVREQGAAGVDIVCDGEFGKLSWNTDINGRLGGHEPVPVKPGEPERVSRDRIEFAQFNAELERGGSYYYRSPGLMRLPASAGPAPARLPMSPRTRRATR